MKYYCIECNIEISDSIIVEKGRSNCCDTLITEVEEFEGEFQEVYSEKIIKELEVEKESKQDKNKTKQKGYRQASDLQRLATFKTWMQYFILQKCSLSWMYRYKTDDQQNIIKCVTAYNIAVDNLREAIQIEYQKKKSEILEERARKKNTLNQEKKTS